MTNFGMEGGFLLEKLEAGGRSSSPSPLYAFPIGTCCWVSLERSRDPLWKTCTQTCAELQCRGWSSRRCGSRELCCAGSRRAESRLCWCRWKVEQQHLWVLAAKWNSTKQKDVKSLRIGELRQVNRRAAELLPAWKGTAEARSRDRKQGNLTHRWLCVVQHH